MEHFNRAAMAGYMASPMGSPLSMDQGASDYLDGAFPPIPGMPDNIAVYETGDFSGWANELSMCYGISVLI